jgi:hypothetical protein
MFFCCQFSIDCYGDSCPIILKTKLNLLKCFGFRRYGIPKFSVVFPEFHTNPANWKVPVMSCSSHSLLKPEALMDIPRTRDSGA